MSQPSGVTNPFDMVYDALWDLAEGSHLLSSLVKPKNRIKLNGRTDYSPIKDEVSRADLPELMLISTGSRGNMQNTSSSSMFIRTYEWMIATGNQNVMGGLLDVEWALFCAMCNWPNVINALQWNGEAFCKRTALTTIDTGLADAERNRGIEGWSSLWGVEVEMHFKTSELLEVNTGTGTGTGT